MTWEQSLIRLLWVLPLVFLNWASLHDIAHGEPDLTMEWTIIVLTAAGLAVLLIRRLRRKNTAPDL